MFLISYSLYGVVHGIAKYIFIGVMFMMIKVVADVVYGVVLGLWIDIEYIETAIYWLFYDIIILWVLWRCYAIARSVEER